MARTVPSAAALHALFSHRRFNTACSAMSRSSGVSSEKFILAPPCQKKLEATKITKITQSRNRL
jgi:hypothetical protein